MSRRTSRKDRKNGRNIDRDFDKEKRRQIFIEKRERKEW